MRTAQTETTGRVLSSMVRAGPSRAKSAPAAMARLAACMTCSWLTSLYANTTVSTRRSRIRVSSFASGKMGMPTG